MIKFNSAAVMDAVNTDPEFLWKAKYWAQGVLRLEFGDMRFDARLEEGRLVSFDKSGVGAADARISGPAEAWEKVLSPVPPPFSQDILGAIMGGITLEGDTVSVIGPFAPAIQRFVGILRQLHSGPVPISTDGDPWPDTDNAVGRYVRIAVDGVQYRVYYEKREPVRSRSCSSTPPERTPGSGGTSWPTPIFRSGSG